MRDYVNMQPKKQQQQGESWLETVLAGISAIGFVVIFSLIALLLGA